jgi:hypothetical protein
MEGIVPKPWPDDPKDIVILYIEDRLDIIEPLIAYIKETWSPRSKGARSKYRALDLLTDSRMEPHLVIHDCMPLDKEEEQKDSRTAGDELYRYLVREGFRVVVFSGLEASTMNEEPYRSHPPLAFIRKPASQEKIRQAVEEARKKSP